MTSDIGTGDGQVDRLDITGVPPRAPLQKYSSGASARLNTQLPRSPAPQPRLVSHRMEDVGSQEAGAQRLTAGLFVRMQN